MTAPTLDLTTPERATLRRIANGDVWRHDWPARCPGGVLTEASSVDVDIKTDGWPRQLVEPLAERGLVLLGAVPWRGRDTVTGGTYEARQWHITGLGRVALRAGERA